jgi:hypothetical protein
MGGYMTAPTSTIANRLSGSMTVSAIKEVTRKFCILYPRLKLSSDSCIVYAINIDSGATVFANEVGIFGKGKRFSCLHLIGEVVQNHYLNPFSEPKIEGKVATLKAGNFFLIIAGLPEPLGRACLVSAAIKNELMTKNEARQTQNDFIKYCLDLENVKN